MSYFASSWTYSKLVKDTHCAQWSHFRGDSEIRTFVLKFWNKSLIFCPKFDFVMHNLNFCAKNTMVQRLNMFEFCEKIKILTKY